MVIFIYKFSFRSTLYFFSSYLTLHNDNSYLFGQLNFFYLFQVKNSQFFLKSTLDYYNYYNLSYWFAPLAYCLSLSFYSLYMSAELSK
jgi:hypothetical protein